MENQTFIKITITARHWTCFLKTSRPTVSLTNYTYVKKYKKIIQEQNTKKKRKQDLVKNYI